MTDEEEIRQLIALWMDADARKDVDGWAAAFTKDGSYRGVLGVSTGREALRRNMARRNEDNPPERQTVHLCAAGTIEVTGDTATAMNPYIAYGRLGNSPWGIMSIGRFHCQLVREDGHWLFTDVANITVGPSGWPATVLLVPESERHRPTIQP